VKTFRSSTFILRTSLVALALVAAASVALAGSITYTATVPSQPTDFSVDATPAIPLYNGINPLESVTISIAGAGTMTINVQNQSASPAGETVTVSGVSQLVLDSGNAGISSLLESFNSNAGFIDSLAGGLSGTHHIAHGGSATYGPFNTSGSFSNTFTSPADVANFIGVGDFFLLVNTNTFQTLTVNGNYAAQTTGTDGALITVQYNVNGITPEPGTLSLFGTGLLGLAGLVRFKFMKSK
jgi:hypothetical protein